MQTMKRCGVSVGFVLSVCLLCTGCQTTSSSTVQTGSGWEPHRGQKDQRPLADWIRADVSASKQRTPASRAYGDLVFFTVRQYHRDLRRCYLDALDTTSGLCGELSVMFTVAGDGSIEAPFVDFTNLSGPEIEPCILKVFESIKLPEPPTPGFRVRYPLVLTSKNTPEEILLALEKRYHLEREEQDDESNKEKKHDDFEAPW